MKILPPKYGKGAGKFLGPTNFLDKNKFVNIKHSGNIPHWEQESVAQFVTFRLNDSLPVSKLIELKETKEQWLKSHPKPWSAEDIIEYEDKLEIIDQWLDKGYGECLLKYEPILNIVEDSLNFNDGKKYELYDYIIMPNHVHMIILPSYGNSLGEIIKDIKSFSSHKINKLLSRKGKIWQRESFDRILRDQADYEEKSEYIKNNWRKYKG